MIREKKKKMGFWTNYRLESSRRTKTNKKITFAIYNNTNSNDDVGKIVSESHLYPFLLMTSVRVTARRSEILKK